MVAHPDSKSSDAHKKPIKYLGIPATDYLITECLDADLLAGGAPCARRGNRSEVANPLGCRTIRSIGGVALTLVACSIVAVSRITYAVVRRPI